VRVWLGVLLLVQFVLVCVGKLGPGKGEQLFWMSHAGLLLAAVGLLTGWQLLVSTALTCVMVPHVAWLADAAILAMRGRSPAGIAAYLQNADAWTWLATVHHFYLVPLLLIVLARDHLRPWASLLAATVIFTGLALISRAVLSPAHNVNYAFRMFAAADHPLVAAVNGLPGWAYMLVLIGGGMVFMLLPGAAVLRGLSR
jgi:hypothetical protein